MGNFHQGGNLWKVAEEKVWSILVKQPTFFYLRFNHFLPAFRGAVKIPV
jgi:hypothetical protein